MIIADLELPLRLVSVSNVREHWATKAKRTREHRALTRLALRQFGPQIPARVTLVRIAPRELDDDNLRGALKAVRDGVADWLLVDDGDPCVVWIYGQEKGGPACYGVHIRVRS